MGFIQASVIEFIKMYNRWPALLAKEFVQKNVQLRPKFNLKMSKLFEKVSRLVKEAFVQPEFCQYRLLSR